MAHPDMTFTGREDPRFLVYVRTLADMMGLRDWEITIGDDALNHVGYGGECEPMKGQKRAVLRFRTDFFDLMPERIRECVTHELVHCHMALMHHLLCDILYRPRDAQAWDAYILGMEFGVDGIATNWAEQLPLPSAKSAGKGFTASNCVPLAGSLEGIG